jgi:Pheromone A receptor
MLTGVGFLRYWRVRRKLLNANWSAGLQSGLCRLEFNRLVGTVISILLFYLPFSLYALGTTIAVGFLPWSWSRVHGPMSNIIVMVPNDGNSVIWYAWIGPLLAITAFLFLGLTRPAKHFSERCVEVVYDGFPASLQKKFPGLKRISETVKKRRRNNSALPSAGSDVIRMDDS